MYPADFPSLDVPQVRRDTRASRPPRRTLNLPTCQLACPLGSPSSRGCACSKWHACSPKDWPAQRCQVKYLRASLFVRRPPYLLPGLVLPGWRATSSSATRTSARHDGGNFNAIKNNRSRDPSCITVFPSYGTDCAFVGRIAAEISVNR